MSQTLQSPNFSQLPGNEMSEKHFKDARLQAPESSWTANLDEYRKKALMTRPGSEVFVVKQSSQPFPADSNEAYNLRTVNQSNQPEFRSQNLPTDQPTVQQVGGFTVRVKDEQGREINDPTVRVREKEEMLQQPAAEFREAANQFPPNPFSDLKEGETLYPLEDLDDGKLCPMHPKLAHQAESGLRPEDLMAYEQLPEIEEQEPLLGEGNFPKSDAMPSNDYTGEMVRPGEGDFPRREVPSIREEGEMVQLGSFPASEMRGRNRDAYFGDSEFPKSTEMRGEVNLQQDAPSQEFRRGESKSTSEVREQQMESKVIPDADVQIQSSFKPVMKEEVIGNKPNESGFITRQEEINPVVGPPELAQGVGPPAQEPERVQPVRGEQPSHEHHSFIGKLKHIFEHDKK